MNKIIEKRDVKKCINKIAVGLIVYTLISVGIVFLDMLIQMVRVFLKEPNLDLQDTMLDQMLNYAMESGWSSIAGVLIGILFLTLYFAKSKIYKSIFLKNTKMSGEILGGLFFVFMSGQFIFSLTSLAIEKFLNIAGYTAIDAMDAASDSTTLSMFLYVSIVGPVVEELVYRGFVMRSFQKYGKLFAIISSSILFGIMHGDLYQNLFAFCVGLVLGYTAMEYSIGWSILLHILNNCVFGELFSMAISRFSENMQEICVWGIQVLMFVIGAGVLWKSRKMISEYCHENKTDKKIYFYTYTAVWIIVFIFAEFLVTLNGIQSL